MENNSRQVADSEYVARLLSKGWVCEGNILHLAFTLRDNETYISVNRPVVPSYDLDVCSFIEKHSDFYADDKQSLYIRALLNVGEVRSSEIKIDDIKLDIDVDVEPRDLFKKSHAGIFTRHEGMNVKKGDTIYVKAIKKEISSDQVLLKVRSRLLDLAQLEYCKIKPTV